MKRVRVHERLAHLMQDGGWTQTKLAETLKLNQSTVSEWVNGKSRPDPAQRKALEVLFGIPEDDWLNAEERAVVARAHAAKTGTEG